MCNNIYNINSIKINVENNNFYKNKIKNKNIVVNRGEIWLADLGEKNGSIQTGTRPVVIYSNRKCNIYSPVVTIIPITSAIHDKANLPTHVLLTNKDGLEHNSVTLVEQVMPLNKYNLIKKLGNCTNYSMRQIEKAYLIQGGVKIPNLKKLIRLTEEINEMIEYLKENNDKHIYNECSMLIIETRKYCYENNINFDYEYDKMLNRFNNLKINNKNKQEECCLNVMGAKKY